MLVEGMGGGGAVHVVCVECKQVGRQVSRNVNRRVGRQAELEMGLCALCVWNVE